LNYDALGMEALSADIWGTGEDPLVVEEESTDINVVAI